MKRQPAVLGIRLGRATRALAGMSGRSCSAPRRSVGAGGRRESQAVRGEGGVARLWYSDSRDAAHGFVETAVLQQVKRGDPHRSVNGQEQGTGTRAVAPVEVANSRQHVADRSIVSSGNGFAVRPVMDAATRDIEQVSEFLPRQPGPASDFHDSLARGLHRHI